MKPYPASIFRETPRQSGVATTAHVLIIAAILCAILYYGKEILVPVALAVLLTFLLTPAVKGLQKRGLPKSLAISSVSLVVLSIIGVLGLVIWIQVASLAQNLPSYESNLRAKISSFKTMTLEGGLFDNTGEMLDRLSVELDKANEPEKEIGEPVSRVMVVAPPTGLVNTYLGVLGPVLKPLMQVALVALFCIFFLFQREDLRDRLIRLAGRGDLLKTTAAMDEAGRKLGKLFMAQAIMNAAFGLFIGVSLFFMGVPAAALWGAIAALMRFVPYVGAILAAVFPIVLAAAISPDWTLPLMVLALFAVSEPIVGHVIEPLLFGHRVGLSPVAIIAAAGFWTAIWGPVGLLLATPLTIVLTVVGRHVEGLAFLDVLFGSRPALSAPQAFYQRLLAHDHHDATVVAEREIVETSMAGFLKDVAVPALKLADDDRQSKRLDHAGQAELVTGFSQVIEDVFVTDGEVEGSRSNDMVLMLPAPGLLNFAATVALSASFSAAGIPHRMLSEDATSPLSTTQFDAGKARVAVVVWLVDPQGERAEFMKRRVRSKFGDLPLLSAAWYATAESEEPKLHAGIAEQVQARIGQAV